MRTIKYNSQRDNINVGGFRPFWQCFSTASFMLMSFYSSKIRAFDDGMLSLYLDDVEASVGKQGIGEEIRKKYKWITGRTSFWWLVQRAGIQKWLDREGMKGTVVFRENVPFGELKGILKDRPVIIQTYKIPPLRGGHIILAVDTDENYIICNDPFGDARTKYRNHNGKNVRYNDGWLKRYTGNKVRCIYWMEDAWKKKK